MANDDSEKKPSSTQPRVSTQTRVAGGSTAPRSTPPRTPAPSQQRKAQSDTMAAVAETPAFGTQLQDDPPTAPSAAPARISSSRPATKEPGSDAYIGTSVAGRYKVLRKLGEGGMGVVYLAEHVFIEKKVAIKILSDDFARKADLVARFMQEAKAASKIGHENIIDITDFGETASGSVFFVMEFLDGGDIAHHIRQSGPMTIHRARPIINQICRALGAAHAKGIIHRDLKPENIYLIEREGKSDFVKILDFGIAKISSLDEGGSRLTRTGMIFGTPEYMSPEQARGDKPDHRVDIYASGCILYEMLTGDVPFHAETFMGVLTKHMFEPPQPPRERAPDADISPEVEAVVLKALSKDRDERYQTMKEMALALEQAVGGDLGLAWGNEGSGVNLTIPRSPSQPIRTPPPRPATAAANSVGRPPTGELELKPKSRTGLVLGIVAVVALAIGGTVIALQKPPEPVTPVVTPPPVAVKPVELPVVEPPPKPVEPVKPAMSRIAIRTTPPDAEVFNGPERLGRTPANLELSSNTAPFDVTIKKKGFKDQRFRLTPDHNREYVIDLVSTKSPQSGQGGKTKERPIVPVEKTPDPKPEVKPAGKLRDLKDPFAN